VSSSPGDVKPFCNQSGGRPLSSLFHSGQNTDLPLLIKYRYQMTPIFPFSPVGDVGPSFFTITLLSNARTGRRGNPVAPAPTPSFRIWQPRNLLQVGNTFIMLGFRNSKSSGSDFPRRVGACCASVTQWAPQTLCAVFPERSSRRAGASRASRATWSSGHRWHRRKFQY
jgi:hypothetical protein